MRNRPYLVLLGLCLSATVQAYIGPGAGISVIGSLIGVVVTVLLAVGAILMWPVRRLMRRRKAKKNEETTDTPSSS